MEYPDLVVRTRHKRAANSTASWKPLTMLVALAALIMEINAGNAVSDIAAYSSSACAGNCGYGSNMAQQDSGA